MKDKTIKVITYNYPPIGCWKPTENFLDYNLRVVDKSKIDMNNITVLVINSQKLLHYYIDFRHFITLSDFISHFA